MATIGDLIDPIKRESIRDCPVILETCCHTYSQHSLIQYIGAAFEERLSNWEFTLPVQFSCGQCRTFFKINDLVVNSAWKKWEEWTQIYFKGKERSLELLNRSLYEVMDHQLKRYEDKLGCNTLYHLASYPDTLLSTILAEYYQKTGSNLISIGPLLKWWKEYRPEISIFKDIRPLHLIGITQENWDIERIKNTPSRKEAFPQTEWAFSKSLQFITLAIYTFSVSFFFEVGLYFANFGGYGLYFKSEYQKLRKIHVIKPLIPLYLKLMGLPFEQYTN